MQSSLCLLVAGRRATFERLSSRRIRRQSRRPAAMDRPALERRASGHLAQVRLLGTAGRHDATFECRAPLHFPQMQRLGAVRREGGHGRTIPQR